MKHAKKKRPASYSRLRARPHSHRRLLFLWCPAVDEMSSPSLVAVFRYSLFPAEITLISSVPVHTSVTASSYLSYYYYLSSLKSRQNPEVISCWLLPQVGEEVRGDRRYSKRRQVNATIMAAFNNDKKNNGKFYLTEPFKAPSDTLQIEK